MPSSTSSDIREARAELGARLRELRRAAGLTGQQLADALSWPQSKVSKIETGRQTPADTDVRAWCAATDAASAMDALVASVHSLEMRHREWQRVLRAGFVAAQQSVAAEEARTEVLRLFQPTMVPGLLQTPEYARTRLAQAARVWGRKDDLDDGVAARMARQAVLYQPARRFHFVITEAVLMNALCPPEVMLVQIDRLRSLAMLPNVRLGIVAFETPFALAPLHSFRLMDDRVVAVEMFSAELHLTQPQEIAHFEKVFETMALDAGYDRRADAILARAAKTLSRRRGRVGEQLEN